MSEERLILPRKPQHHKHRFLLAVIVGGAAVTSIWGLQMKMTFDKYAAERAGEVVAADAMETAKANLATPDSGEVVQNGVDAIRAMMEEVAREQAAKDQVLEQVTEGMKTELSGQVAGETIEVPAN